MNDHPVDGWDVLEQARALAERGEEFALATVVWRQAPSSGQSGSRAIITASGKIHGWIGGACAEPVVLREARRVIADREARLLLLGAPDQFAGVPDGITMVPIACQSEGALAVYIEPVLSRPHLVVVGRSPMAHTLVELARVLGWRSNLIEREEFSAADVDRAAVVVVATQGQGDEEAIEQALAGAPAYVGLVASRRRGEAVLGYLADRGVAQDALDRVRVPIGLDLGHTSHQEIAVAILAELVQLRAAGALSTIAQLAPPVVPTAVDPVCGMTVPALESSWPVEHEGVTYHFCCAGCRSTFEMDPATYATGGTRC